MTILADAILAPSLVAGITAFSSIMVGWFAYGRVSKQRAALLEEQTDGAHSEAIRDRAEASAFITDSARDLIEEHRRLYAELQRQLEQAKDTIVEMTAEIKTMRLELDAAGKTIQRFRQIAGEHGIPDDLWIESA